MQKKFVVLLAAAMMMTAPTLGITAPSPGSNTVNSAAIIDGEVKTPDIANLAVTTAKIANGAVTATQLANGAVTAAKLGIVCSTGQILQYTSTGWVCSAGTPGPVGPQGPQGIQGIQGSAGAVGPDGPQGLKGDTGATGATGPQGPVGQTPHYANVVVVAKSGGDFTDPVAALNSITDASAVNPYLVKIMPGVYDIGAYSLKIQSYVDVEGSGKNNTIINATNADSVIAGANYSQVRGMQIINTCLSLNYCSGIAATQLDNMLTQEKSTFKVKDMSIVINGTAQFNSYGISTNYSSIDVNESDITNLSTGLHSVGIQSNYSYLTVKNSNITVNNTASGSSTGIETSDSNWINRPDVSHLVENVTVTVKGNVGNNGINVVSSYYSNSGTPTVRNSTIYVFGPGTGLGSTDKLTVSDVEILVDAKGGHQARGVEASAHPLNVQYKNMNIKVSGGTDANIGFLINGYNMPTALYSTNILNSTIKVAGPWSSVIKTFDYIAKVSFYQGIFQSDSAIIQSGSANDVFNAVGTQLIGSTQVQAPFKKLNCFDANFDPIP